MSAIRACFLTLCIPLLAVCLWTAVGAQDPSPAAVEAGDTAPAIIVPTPDDDDCAISPAESPAPAGETVVEATPPITAGEVEEISGALAVLLGTPGSHTAGVTLAAVLTIVIGLLRKFTKFGLIPKQYVPWIAAFTTMLGDVVAALSAGASWSAAVLQGLLVGAAAIGFWEMAGKRVIGKPVTK